MVASELPVLPNTRIGPVFLFSTLASVVVVAGAAMSQTLLLPKKRITRINNIGNKNNNNIQLMVHPK
jgi:hypothetical protein